MYFENLKIGIIGLGYVGLPLAIEFGKKYKVVGFDIDKSRINQLLVGNDRTKEVSKTELLSTLEKNKSDKHGLCLTYSLERLSDCNIFIVTVPTPIDKFKTPNLNLLISATEMVGSILKKGDIVVYESTVYPGCTEEDCVPVLENASGLIYNKDFFCGYSPERINPGDRINTLINIKKVTSGSTPEIAEKIDFLYNTIIKAGTHKASSIKVAEASKAIENAQRDINISFVNELALIFDKMGIDTMDVIDAAATKWNFLKYTPGLVGGHCIGVDPYYLAHKAESVGYHPQVILSGRRVNDHMGMFVANKSVKLMIQNGLQIKGADALILGVTFKENCPDIRNSRFIDIYSELVQYGMNVDVFDPHACSSEVYEEYRISMISEIEKKYHLIIIAVSHNEFLNLDYNSLKQKNESIIFDTKSFLEKKLVNGRL